MNETKLSHRTLFCARLLEKKDVKNKTILDLGSSDDYWMSKILVSKKAKKVIAIDPFLSKEIVRDNLLSFKADVFDKRLDDYRFDTVVMFDVLEHIPVNSELKTIRRVAKLLNTQGKLYLTTPHNNTIINYLDPAWYFGHRHYRASDLKALFEKNEFNIVKSGVTGGLFESTRVVWLYVQKHLLRRKEFSFPSWLWNLSSNEFNKPGIMTNWVIAEKR